MTLLPIVTPSVPKQNGTSGSVEERVTLDTPKMAYRHVLLPSSHGVNTFAVDVMASSEYHVTAWAMLPCVPDALPYIGVSPSAYAPDSAARQTAMASLRSLETIPFCSFTSGLLSLCKYATSCAPPAWRAAILAARLAGTLALPMWRRLPHDDVQPTRFRGAGYDWNWGVVTGEEARMRRSSRRNTRCPKVADRGCRHRQEPDERSCPCAASAGRSYPPSPFPPPARFCSYA